MDFRVMLSVKDREAKSPLTADTLSVSLRTVHQPALPPQAKQCLTLVILLFFSGTNISWTV